MKCLLVQPIHPAGIALMEEAGIEVTQASAADMATVAREVVDADAAITRNAGFDRQAMAAGARLRLLGNHGVGLDPVDTDYAAEIGLPVVYTPYGNVQSVAELAISQMIAIAKRVREADAAVRNGDFDYRYTRDFNELSGRKLAVVGFGRIGRRTAEIARAAFDMQVTVVSTHADPAALAAEGWRHAPLDEALVDADYVSLHRALTDDSRHMFDRARLSSMKRGAVLVNTARGALVEAEALVEAVDSAHLRGAAMDVFEQEPLPVDHPYVRTPGILLSPHIGGASEQAMARTATQVARQIVDALNGCEPEYLVSPDVWAKRRVV